MTYQCCKMKPSVDDLIGQGLVENDRVDEIQAGTPLANVWDCIKSKFPWYERLDKLFGSNPAIDRSAIVNSQTPVDTSILETTTKKTKLTKQAHSAIFSDSESGSQAADDDSVDHEDKSTPKKAGSAHENLATLRGTKHKASIMDQITELANEDRSQRLKIIEVKQKEKTHCLQTKYQTQNELELACMRHQEQQAALQRQHDLHMME
ncbi:hypothetical protein BYT27DRAFT_7213742 [Phlegmacium glaucopus]|nr:hypothetical protein BYT27DRAFT_7213742 [Phlegmacium glaucopus]